MKKRYFLTSVFLFFILCSCGNGPMETTTVATDDDIIIASEEAEPEIYTGTGDWTSGLFESSSIIYNNKLAMVAAEMSKAAEDNSSEGILRLLSDYRLYACEAYNYGDSAAFVIGQDNLYINGRETTILVIVARGTQTIPEQIGDAFRGGEQPFLDQIVWNNVYDFEEKIWKELDSYIEKYPSLKTESDLKILVTGHSLGGAAANTIGARFTYGVGQGEWWSDKVSKDDIYVYTFGAIKVLAGDRNVSEGFENIHNVYSKYDSFGPDGNLGYLYVSSPNAKFGHTEIFDQLNVNEEAFSCNNHLMENYIKALEQKYVTCSREDYEEKIADLPADDAVNSNVDDQYTAFEDFAIEGKWKSIGTYGFGQAQPGAIVIFDGTHCNFYSPSDTYALYQEDGVWRLDCTDFLFAITVSFTVEIVDNDNIHIYYGTDVTELKRVN